MPAPSDTNDPLAAYQQARAPLPDTYQRWHLYGAGLENVGRDGEPESVPLERPAADQILVRHDACGICYSDIKIITLGANHPRLVGRDLARDPVVMGHEVALTIIEAGTNHRNTFEPGQRFIVQADIYYGGMNLAYGYALRGGMSQYGLIGPEVLEGDDGCYLLPLKDSTGYAEAALVEPWACVEAAYHWTEQREPARADRRATFAAGRFTGVPLDTEARIGGDEKVDAISFDSAPSSEVFEAACAHLATSGVAFLNSPPEGLVRIDVGRVHYDGHLYVGPKPNGRSEIKGGGTAWFIGAAGPMGQMHVQRALSLPHPPARLITTDRNPQRIAALREHCGPLARARGVELIQYNVKEDGPPDFARIAPQGFDDIVVLVPDVSAIEDAFPRLAEGGVLNIFAGLARGTMAILEIGLVATRNVRIVGTSGSSIHDMTTTRDLLESGRLQTGASLAAIGGMEAFRDGLAGVRDGRFPGKTVIFPNIANLPLTALTDLAPIRPNVYAKLLDGTIWTKAAEDELLREGLRAS